MSISKYYRLVIWLPILLPITAVPAFVVINKNDWSRAFFPLSQMDFAGIILFLVGSLLWGGVPYLLTLALHYKTLASDDIRAQRRVIWTLPLRMVPILCVCVSLFFSFSILGVEDRASYSRQFDLTLMLFILGYISVVTLLLGYLYVLIMQGVLWFLQFQGFVQSTSPIAELRTRHSRFTDESGR